MTLKSFVAALGLIALGTLSVLVHTQTAQARAALKYYCNTYDNGSSGISYYSTHTAFATSYQCTLSDCYDFDHDIESKGIKTFCTINRPAYAEQ